MTTPVKRDDMIKSIISIIALGIIIGLGIVAWPSLNQNTELKTAHLITTEQPKGGNFTLLSSDGEVSLSDFQGKLVVLYFGYTFCPDICPTNLGSLSLAYQALTPAQKEQVQVLFISIDPVRDTPERLKQYTGYFAMNAIGLTGTPANLNQIARNYGVVYLSHQTNPDDQYYAVDHSAFTYIIDPQGQLTTQLPHATSAQEFTNAIQNTLK